MQIVKMHDDAKICQQIIAHFQFIKYNVFFMIMKNAFWICIKKPEENRTSVNVLSKSLLRSIEVQGFPYCKRERYTVKNLKHRRTDLLFSVSCRQI